MTVLLFLTIMVAGICTVLVMVVVVCGIWLWWDKHQMRRLLKTPKPSTEWAEDES